MAIPAMITGFGEQSANYGAAVGQSLAQLGQQVGQQLAMREYQKQASAALPAMQQSYDEAFSKMGTANYLDGYKQLLQTNLQYGSTQNPFLAQYVEQANQTAKQLESAMWRQAQYGGRGGAAGGAGMPAMGPSGAQTAMDAMYGRTPTETTETVTTDTVTTGYPPGQPTATLLPPGAIVEPDLPEDDTGADLNQPDDAMVGVGEEGPDAVQQAAAASVAQAIAAPPSTQTKAIESAIADKDDEGVSWKPQQVEGLSRLFPKQNISDTINIAPVGSNVKYSETWTGKTDRPGAQFTGRKEIIVDDKMNVRAKEFALELQKSVNLLTQSGPADQEKYWADIIEEAGGIENVIPQPPVGEDKTFKIKPKGKDAIDVPQEVFNAIVEIKGLSAIAAETGIKLTPAGGPATGELRSRRFGSAEEALMSGAAIGQPVYVLKGGKYQMRNYTAQEQQAMQWASQNPDDPRAAKIKEQIENK
jgi:hypothetical protein